MAYSPRLSAVDIDVYENIDGGGEHRVSKLSDRVVFVRDFYGEIIDFSPKNIVKFPVFWLWFWQDSKLSAAMRDRTKLLDLEIPIADTDVLPVDWIVFWAEKHRSKIFEVIDYFLGEDPQYLLVQEEATGGVVTEEDLNAEDEVIFEQVSDIWNKIQSLYGEEDVGVDLLGREIVNGWLRFLSNSDGEHLALYNLHKDDAGDVKLIDTRLFDFNHLRPIFRWIARLIIETQYEGTYLTLSRVNPEIRRPAKVNIVSKVIARAMDAAVQVVRAVRDRMSS